MEQINTLFDRNGVLDQTVLPDGLRILYGGDLRFPEPDGRPLDLPPVLTQAVKTQNPFKGELSHGVDA